MEFIVRVLCSARSIIQRCRRVNVRGRLIRRGKLGVSSSGGGVRDYKGSSRGGRGEQRRRGDVGLCFLEAPFDV